MTRAERLRSRVRVNSHARFWSGGGTGDRPPDHNVRPKAFLSRPLVTLYLLYSLTQLWCSGVFGEMEVQHVTERSLNHHVLSRSFVQKSEKAKGPLRKRRPSTC